MDICAGAALRTLVSLLKMYLPLYSGFFFSERSTVLPHRFYIFISTLISPSCLRENSSNNSHHSKDVFFLWLTSNALCI